MTTMNEYQDRAAETALYPSEQGLSYTALGLAGEAGEVANKVKKIIRDADQDNGHEMAERLDGIVAELGDVLWYVAMVAKECGSSLEDIANSNLAKLRSRD
ncbi:MAG: nucleoside triphosphate pyrophosphohydrolase family protein, partial [Ghiorsea sp.]